MGGTSILTCGPSGVGVEPVPATLTKHHRCNAAQLAYQAAFSRQFRATTGLTPRDYRKAFQSSVQ
jgi:hypothetical protein